MKQLISFSEFKQAQTMKTMKQTAYVYRLELLKLSKFDLLQELLKQHEGYIRDPKNPENTLRGQHLLEVLEQRADLSEMRELAQELSKKLKIRLYQQMQQMGGAG